MFQFPKFFIKLPLVFFTFFCSTHIIEALNSQENISPILKNHESLPISHTITGSDHHQITKRNAFETLRELTSLTSDSGGDAASQLIVNRRIYNSSIALTIPFFSFKIPHLLNGGFIVNEALFGVFAWGITALVFGLSFIFTGSVPSDEQSRSFSRLSNRAKTSNFNFLGSDYSNSFGMDGMQCIQKVICQAHNPKEGRRYGIMATSIRKLFPAPENATQAIESDSTSSPFQSAARAGKYAGKQICDNLYDCILDPLGSARYLVHWYSHKYDEFRPFLLKLVDYADDTNNSTTVFNESIENL